MPDLLTPIAYDPSFSHLLTSFNFGDESFQRELLDWILNDAPRWIPKGTRVWLYANRDDEIVGYGSLGTAIRRIPDGAKFKVAVIPAVAIRKEFQGCPPDVAWSERYSSQLIRHLIQAVDREKLDLPVLELFVHPNNPRAIRLYERHGFQRSDRTYTDKDGTVYVCMERALPEPTAI